MAAAESGGFRNRLVRTLAGPGTIEPRAIVVVALVAMIVRLMVRAGAFLVETSVIVEFVVKGALLTISVGLTAAVLAVGVPRIAERLVPLAGKPIGRARYLLVLGVIALGTTVVLVVLSNWVLIEPVPDVVRERHVVMVAIVSFALIFALVVIANGLEASFQDRMNRTEVKYRGELATVRTDRIMLLAAEERVRQEIARTLHDDIQTELLRASMRLSTISMAGPIAAIAARAVSASAPAGTSAPR